MTKPSMAGKHVEDGRYEQEEVQLAGRNRGTLLESLAYPITPTGMHYLLVHFDVPMAEPETWALSIAGLVSKPLTLSLDDLRQRPAVTTAVTLECAGNGRSLLHPRYVTQPWFHEAVSTARWTGTPLAPLLREAGIDDTCVEFVFTGRDEGIQGGEVQFYQRSLSVAEAMHDGVLLAYEMNGEPLQPQHGFPLRLVVPGWYGMTSVKWLTHIEAVAEPFQGYQMISSYRYSTGPDDPGEPVSHIRVRALMVPPGIPDFFSRSRRLQPGPVTLRGRAWAGRIGIARVEVSVDGGSTWCDAELEAPESPYSWTGWHCDWNAEPGAHTLCVRATDRDGNQQPIEPFWTRQGMGNNMVHRVDVQVE
ncbi:sulfite oxidase [Candidatus Entotheonella palauensis]|uniref:sulfite oxidase n=1 Tax=Candidatus Entotheonella palauensis TaxID=93172 RepID=UPI002118423A|nr:sulfite oxidase [Candidatus Entotheonella palauensis]